MVIKADRNTAQCTQLIKDFLEQNHIIGEWLETQSPLTTSATVDNPLNQLADLCHTVEQTTAALNNPSNRRAETLAKCLYKEATFPQSDTSKNLLSRYQIALEGLSSLANASFPDTVEINHNPIRTSDLLRWQTLRLAIICDEWQSYSPTTPLPLNRNILFTAVRTLAELIREAHPGKSVEVRIPPAVAVQIASPNGDGSRHTRGTPPTVVETDPLTFLRLGAGTISWQQALNENSVIASGVHADLSCWFPLNLGNN
ncbi:MAG: sterol carrier family protein [Propionibacteriaceae bacterium]